MTFKLFGHDVGSDCLVLAKANVRVWNANVILGPGPRIKFVI